MACIGEGERERKRRDVEGGAGEMQQERRIRTGVKERRVERRETGPSKGEGGKDTEEEKMRAVKEKGDWRTRGTE